MNAKVVGVVISFTALATLLNYIKIPVPYLAGFFYQLGDVVLIVTLLLFGAKPAITIASLNMVLTIVLYQNPAGPIGPPYYLISVLATFFGIYLALRIKGHRRATRRHLLELASISTISGVLSRTLIMLPLDYYLYGFLVSVVSGLSIAESYSIVMIALPSMIIYNITVPIIMVPIGFLIANRMCKFNPLMIKDNFI
jgi:riboflavin transporter FmnP